MFASTAIFAPAACAESFGFQCSSTLMPTLCVVRVFMSSKYSPVQVKLSPLLRSRLSSSMPRVVEHVEMRLGKIMADDAAEMHRLAEHARGQRGIGDGAAEQAFLSGLAG